MGLFRQTWTLTTKTILIVLNRHVFTTTIRALILPIAFMIFLSYARNLFFPPSTYGISSGHPILSLKDGLNAATGGRHTLVLINNGLSGGDIDQVIELVASPAREQGATVTLMNDEAELLNICKSSLRGVTNCYGAVVFNSSPTEGNGGIWNYTMRADGALGTEIYVDRSTNDQEVYLLPLQHAVDYAIATVDKTINETALPNSIIEYPYTSITQEQRETSIRVAYMGTIIDILGIAFLIGMVGVTYHLTGFMAYERELGMAQLLEAMMPNIRRWEPQVARLFSNHLAFSIIYIPGWILMGVVLGIGVFVKTSMAIVVIYHLLFGLSLTSFSILGASFFRKAQLSGISMTITTLLLGVIVQVVGITSNGSVVVLSLLFAPCNYVFFILFMARYERQNIPTDLVNSAPKNPWTIPGIVLWVFIIIQIIVYPILGALVEKYLYSTKSVGRKLHSGQASDGAAVQLQDFSKHYKTNSWFSMFKGPSRTVIAVNSLTLSALKGQILVLLGANGSGKSTTLDAIAGLNTVTDGTISVDNTGGIGIAPQKNVLWDELTVFEHIRIFNRLKSTTSIGDKETLLALVSAIDLDHKITAKSKTLSGGQKRKLQLGMAFTGGSAVCCIDEVSSGLDPLSRRKIWDILLAERGNRTLILTTHFLDEADLLSDHIAILSKGTLRAQGSAVELKSNLGGGYRIHLYGSDHIIPPDFQNIRIYTAFDQTTFSVKNSSQAANIIRWLEQSGKEYQLTSPSIEDVFLGLAEEIQAEDESSSEVSSALSSIVKQTEKSSAVEGTFIATNKGTLQLLSGHRISFGQQAWVLFRKRLTILRRNWLPFTAAFLMPIIAAGLVTLFLKNAKAVGCSPTESVSTTKINSFNNRKQYHVLAGPATSFSPWVPLFAPFTPTGEETPSTDVIANHVNLTITLGQFNAFVDQAYSVLTPGGAFMGDSSSTPTIAYEGNSHVYNSIFAQNIFDIVTMNTTIATQYSRFNIPWEPSTGKSLQLVVYFCLVMAAYPGFFALYPTVERTRNVRGLELSNGVRSLPLWLAYLSFDWIIVLFTSAFAVIIFAASSNIWYHVGYLYLIFILFGLASILLSYVVSMFARSQLAAFAFSAAGQAVMFLIYLVAYLCTMTYAPINKIDHYLIVVHFTVSLVTPTGSLMRSMFLALNLFSTTCVGREIAPNPGGILQYGGPILYLIIQIFVLFGVLLWIDSGSVTAWWQRLRKPAAKPQASDEVDNDDEVAEELHRVSTSNDGLRVLHLTKSFGSNTAVDNLTFGIQTGEVFALLGPNGAGKSTTISLIRGDIQPSQNGGDVFIENIAINKHRADARSHLGVCPQYDAIDQMTVLEHLRFYARVRGISDVDHNVEQVLQAVGLQAFASRMAGKLSGGNKRKLSLGIALMGNPSVVLLDEPSSGMDAAAKRIMWKTLESIVPGRSILLTTHSMEEADALAGRAGIMARRMLALGTTDDLRHAHGDVAYVHLVTKSAPHSSDEEMARISNWILTTFPGAEVEDKTYHGQMRFSVPGNWNSGDRSKLENTSITELHDGESIVSASPTMTGTSQRKNHSGIGALIGVLESQKEILGLEHYSVGATTLDQVFLSVIQKHNVEEENSRSPVKKRRGFKLKGLMGR